MNQPATLARRNLLLALVLCTSAGCTKVRRQETVSYDPVYTEAEPNGNSVNANYFGDVLPGDHFFIDGFLDGDELDGFAFTSAGPVHVDFRLWINDPNSDLDVCLYDPQTPIPLDPIVDCFQTTNNPEEGGVDVDFGGLEFQLLVESFRGFGSYSLEISAVPLLIAARASSAGDASIRGIHKSEASGERGIDAKVRRYADRPNLGSGPSTVTRRSLDPETGAAIETEVLFESLGLNQ